VKRLSQEEVLLIELKQFFSQLLHIYTPSLEGVYSKQNLSTKNG